MLDSLTILPSKVTGLLENSFFLWVVVLVVLIFLPRILIRMTMILTFVYLLAALLIGSIFAFIMPKSRQNLPIALMKLILPGEKSAYNIAYYGMSLVGALQKDWIPRLTLGTETGKVFIDLSKKFTESELRWLFRCLFLFSKGMGKGDMFLKMVSDMALQEQVTDEIESCN